MFVDSAAFSSIEEHSHGFHESAWHADLPTRGRQSESNDDHAPHVQERERQRSNSTRHSHRDGSLSTPRIDQVSSHVFFDGSLR